MSAHISHNTLIMSFQNQENEYLRILNIYLLEKFFHRYNQCRWISWGLKLSKIGSFQTSVIRKSVKWASFKGHKVKVSSEHLLRSPLNAFVGTVTIMYYILFLSQEKHFSLLIYLSS